MADVGKPVIAECSLQAAHEQEQHTAVNHQPDHREAKNPIANTKAASRQRCLTPNASIPITKASTPE